MRRGTKVTTSVAVLVTLVVTGIVWRRSFVAAFRAFDDPGLIEGADVAPAGARTTERPGADDARLDRQLAADFVELSGLDLVMNDDARLADLRPEDLPIPITRRALRYVRFFTRDDRGRRAFEHLYRRSGRYRERLLTALREAQLPEDLLWLVAVESNFDPAATSPARAAGLWQIMPALASDYGLAITPWIDERRNLDRGTGVAVRHLRRLHDALGAWDLALAAYNMGETGLRDAIAELRLRRQGRGEAPGQIGVAQLAQEGLVPAETADYVPKVTALAVVAANLERFRFDQLAPDGELRGSTVSVPPETRLATLAKAAAVPIAILRDLNPELLGEATPPGADYPVAVPASQLNRALATLPVYLDQAAREAEGLDVLAPADPSRFDVIDRQGSGAEPPYRLMAAWLDALRAQTVLGEPVTGLVDVPGQLGRAPTGLMELGGVNLAGASDPLRLLRPGAWKTSAPIVHGGGRTAAIADRRLEAALGFLTEPEGRQEPLGGGVTLRLERDPNTARVAITVTLGRDLQSDWRRAPLVDQAVRESAGEQRFTEVVRPTELDVGLRIAVGRLALWLAQSADPTRGATRALINRHRRVALGRLDRGDAWLALSDLLFPPGDASHGRLVDPRGIDGAWLADRLVLAEQARERSPADATITVAGHFDPDEVRQQAKSAVAGLGLGIAGRLPPVGLGEAVSRPIVDLDVARPELLVAYRIPGLDAEDHVVALVTLELIAGRQRSLIRSELLEGELVDAYQADTDPDWDRGVATLQLTPRPGVTPARIQEALDRITARLAETGPTGIELAYAETMVRSRLTKRLRASRRERPGGAPASASRMLEALRPGTLDRWRQATRDVHRRDVQRLVRSHFAQDQRVVVEIRPRKPIGEVASR